MRTEDGIIWVGTADGLNLFDPETGIFTRFLDRATTRVSQVNAITGDGGKGVWVGTENGLLHFDRPSRTYQIYTHSAEDPNL